MQFLERALIPLHKTRGVALYHPQLSYCISQYVEKDPDTIVPIVRGLIRFWPWSSAFKQVLFLNEVEEILELCRPEQLSLVQDDFAYLLSACLSSPHFQVTERALYYWNSENLCSNVLSQAKAASLLPLVFAPLSRSAQGHWNQTVEGLAQSVLKVGSWIHLLASFFFGLLTHSPFSSLLPDSRCTWRWTSTCTTSARARIRKRCAPRRSKGRPRRACGQA